MRKSLILNVLLMMTMHASPSAAARVIDSEAQSTPRPAFEARVAYLTRDGGYWLAENPIHDGDPRSPTHFSYQFGLAFDGALMQNHIGGLFTGGRSVTDWRSLTWYDADAATVRQRNWSSDDVTTGGVLVFRDDGSEMIELSGRMWDGSAVVFRDVSIDDGPDQFTSHSIHLVDGEWVERSVMVWRRVPPPTSTD